MTLYCQGCDYSFTDRPANAFPHHCPRCFGAHWATWKRGETPAAFTDTVTGGAPLGAQFSGTITGPGPGAVSVTVIPFSGGTS